MFFFSLSPKDVVLPPAPFGYQPFSILDVMLEEEAQKKAKNSKTAGLAGQLRIGAKLNKGTGDNFSHDAHFHLMLFKFVCKSGNSWNLHASMGS